MRRIGTLKESIGAGQRFRASFQMRSMQQLHVMLDFTPRVKRAIQIRAVGEAKVARPLPVVGVVAAVACD